MIFHTVNHISGGRVEPAISNPNECLDSFESCFKYNISSRKFETKGQRQLFLTAHFQEMQYPPRRSGSEPLFSYTLKSAELSINLLNSSMPIEEIEPIVRFDLYRDESLKTSTQGEISGGVELSLGKEFATSPKMNISGKSQASSKKINTSSSEFSSRKYTAEFIHASNTELYLRFYFQGQSLIGTLKDRLLGNVHYSKGAKVRARIKINEKDICSQPNKEMILGGLQGFVAFKYYRRAIANQLTDQSSLEISL